LKTVSHRITPPEAAKRHALKQHGRLFGTVGARCHNPAVPVLDEAANGSDMASEREGMGTVIAPQGKKRPLLPCLVCRGLSIAVGSIVRGRVG